jgi:phosphate-selective porin OprO/OprP
MAHPTRSRVAPLLASAVLAKAAIALAQPAPPEGAGPLPEAVPTQAAPDAATEERFRRLEQRLEQVERENQSLRSAQAARDEAAAKAAAAAASASRPDASRVPLRATFKDGVTLEGEGGDFRLHVGDLVQVDGRYFPGTQATNVLDNFALRSVRLEIDGTAWGVIDFRFEPDFAGGTLQIQYAYTDLHFFKPLRLRAGKFKVPFGLERLQPEGRTAFLERAFPTSISPNRDIGVALLGDFWDGAALAEVGVFNGVVDNTTVDVENDDDKEVAGRLFFHPLRPTRIAALHDLGVGGAFSYGELRGSLANPNLNSIKTDGLNTFFKYVAGTTPTAENTALAAGERIRGAVNGYWYVWRLGLLAEYTWNSQQVRLAATRDAVVTQAAQAYVTFLLTRDRAAYGGVRPARPIHLARDGFSLGAFEIGFRYSRFWVNDTAVNDQFIDLTKTPRAASSYTAGLNWYLSPSVKFQLDYVYTDFSGGASKGADRPAENLLAGRLQHSF